MNFNKIFDELYPINRSITGKGYVESLAVLSRYINFKYLKYKSGKKIFDWKVPDIWVINDAFIKFKGKKIVNFKKNNLHVVNYSERVNKVLSLSSLEKNIYYLKKNPNLIPYVTSYYKKNWGFCMSYNTRKKLKKGKYKIYIDSKFKKCQLINAISTIKGNSKKVNLLTSYLCHPSMANNELSGPLVLMGLYQRIKKWKKRNFSYSFLINPETIGSLCFLSSKSKYLKQYLNYGMVLTCLGGYKKKLSYKLSKNENSLLNKLMIFLNKKKKLYIRKFTPASGSDERQYCSPGFNLPVGQISRTVYGQYPEYHTSGDNKKFMNIKTIEKTINELEKILKLSDNIFPLERKMPYGELMLGKRNLYPNTNSFRTWHYSNDIKFDNRKFLNILMNILSYADGKNDILDVANITGFKLDDLNKVLEICLEKKLIKKP